jgi:DNA ligase (NAD+)
MDAEQISRVDGVGEKIGQSVAQFMAERTTKKLFSKFEKAGILLDLPAAPAGGPLTGKTAVVTGTLPTLSRDQAHAAIKSAGGKVADSVSRKTSFVVVGEDAGSKFTKAKELGVETIDEAELLRRLKV